MKKKLLGVYFPAAYALAWLIGFTLSTLEDSFREVAIEWATSNPTLYSVFFSTICVYIVFLMECAFNFIEISIKEDKTRFSGGVFRLMGEILLHFVLTFIFIILFINTGNTYVLWFLMVIIAIFKFFMVYISNNIHKWVINVTVGDYTSNI